MAKAGDEEQEPDRDGDRDDDGEAEHRPEEESGGDLRPECRLLVHGRFTIL